LKKCEEGRGLKEGNGRIKGGEMKEGGRIKGGEMKEGHHYA
jgi:hypothetical protein